MSFFNSRSMSLLWRQKEMLNIDKQTKQTKVVFTFWSPSKPWLTVFTEQRASMIVTGWYKEVSRTRHHQGLPRTSSIRTCPDKELTTDIWDNQQVGRHVPVGYLLDITSEKGCGGECVDHPAWNIIKHYPTIRDISLDYIIWVLVGKLLRKLNLHCVWWV